MSETTTIQVKKNDISPFKNKWWESKEEEVFRDVVGVLDSIETTQNYRHEMNLRHARLYANMEFLGFYGTDFMRESSVFNLGNRITLNVIKSCVDTVTSRIAKNHPRPLFLTEKGKSAQQDRAKGLTKFIAGGFEDCKVYEKGTQSFTDSCVLGTGGLKFYRNDDEKKICVERTMIDEIIVDDAEALSGNPRSLYQRKYMDRDLVYDLFGKDEKTKQLIKSAGSGLKSQSTSSADLVRVVEAWHLPSSSKNPGRHVICLDNVTLAMEEWKKKYFPFVFIRWSPRLLGFYGAGIPEELMSIQIQINRILRNVEESIRLHAIPRVWVEDMAKVATIINKVGSIHKYRGKAPIFETPSAMSPDVYNHLESLVQKAYQIVGVSQMSANSIKPAGLDSAVAQREFNDNESERFAVTSQRYERMYMDAAYIYTDMSRDIYKEHGNLTVKVKGSKFIETIKWKDVDLEDDKFIMDIFPTSLLPTQPAGRLAKVQELMNAGFLDKEMALSLLDFPDLSTYTSLATANLNITKKMIDSMLEDGRYTSPEPFMNLDGAIKLAQASYLEAKENNVPEEKLELVRQFMDECQDMLDFAASRSAQPAVISGQSEINGVSPMDVAIGTDAPVGI